MCVSENQCGEDVSDLSMATASQAYCKPSLNPAIQNNKMMHANELCMQGYHVKKNVEICIN